MKKHKLIILAPAQRELEAIADIYSHLAGMDSAIKITDKILDALERLEAFPLIGVLHHDRILRNQGYRTLVVDKYICVYRIIEKNIYVYHIVHGATDYPQLFKEARKEE